MCRAAVIYARFRIVGRNQGALHAAWSAHVGHDEGSGTVASISTGMRERAFRWLLRWPLWQRVQRAYEGARVFVFNSRLGAEKTYLDLGKKGLGW